MLTDLEVVSDRFAVRPMSSKKFIGRAQSEAAEKLLEIQSGMRQQDEQQQDEQQQVGHRGLLRGVGLSLLLLWGGFLISMSGCARTEVASSVSNWERSSTWTPVDHARSQLDWIRRSSESLSEEELFHAMNTPWSGRRLTPAQRQAWIRNQLMDDSKDTGVSSVSSQRVLGRPGAMDSARQRWQKELEEN